MRIFVCHHGRTSDAIEDLITALLQEGHPVHAGKPDRAARRFTPELVVAAWHPGHAGAAWFARRQHLPLCLFVHTEPRRPPSLFDRMTWRTATRVIAATAALKDAVAALGTAPERIDIFPGGAVLDYILPPPFAPARASGAIVLGWFGGNAPASIAAQDLALTVIGDDIPRVRAADLIAGVDVALFPQPSPARLIDCMAAGRAIVAPGTPEVRELLEHERTALLFNHAEPDALLRTAARLIADAPLRTQLGEAARADLLRRDLTWRGLARRIGGTECSASSSPC